TKDGGNWMWGMARRGPRTVARIIALAAVLVAAAAPIASADKGHKGPGPGSGGTATGASSSGAAAVCSQRPPGQAFLASGDFNYYSPAPGPLGLGYDGSTWSLSGGASVVSAQHPDGATGDTLDLPAGSQAVSPDICVDPSTN